MHKLLKRQLRREKIAENDFNRDYNSLLERISQSYIENDQSRYLMERSLKITSLENQERIKKINLLLEENHRANQLLETQNNVLTEIIKSSSFEELLKLLCNSITNNLPKSGCVFHSYDKESNSLNLELNHLIPKNFVHEIKSVPVQENMNPCSTAAHRRSAVFISNLHENTLYSTKNSNEIRSCWSYPVITKEGNLLGVFTLFFMTIVKPQKKYLDYLKVAAQTITIIVEREENQKTILEQHAKSITSGKLAALGEMAGGIAHEINNPLAIISGLANKLKILHAKNRLEENTIPDVANELFTTVKRIKNIVDALRTYSREDSSVNVKENSVQDMIQSALNLCTEKIKSLGIRINLNLDDEKEMFIRCNEIQVGQVLMNLINNSIDEIKNHNDPWINIELKEDQEFIYIYVTDSGEGIPKDIREKIMQPFFTTKDVGSGTGIGLSLSQGIIKKHGGELLYNEDSPNTQFVIKLPFVGNKKGEIAS